MTKREVADIIDTEGLEYAILNYLEDEEITDLKLRRAIAKARTALLNVTKLTQSLEYESELGEDDDDGDCED